MTKPLHIDFHLLDRQIVDRDGALVGNVDDVELDDDLRVVALLVGQLALGDRIGGRVGGLMSAVARRLAPQAHPTPMRIPFPLVDKVGSEIRLTAVLADLGDLPLEAWLREHLVDRIPEPTVRASELLGRPVYGADGTELGRIVDLVTHRDADGVPRVTAALVTPGRRGRLLGYERPGIQGPWIIERLAGRLHRGTREIPWPEVRLRRS